jgi:CHAT domain-containing protein
VSLQELQAVLKPSEVLLEYVFTEPNSYVLAITRDTVNRYMLKARIQLEGEASECRSILLKQKVDIRLAEQIFADLIGPIPEYKQKQSVLLVLDGNLHLLPFAALASRPLRRVTAIDGCPSSRTNGSKGGPASTCSLNLRLIASQLTEHGW